MASEAKDNSILLFFPVKPAFEPRNPTRQDKFYLFL